MQKFYFFRGVAQNIKATQKILEDNKINSIFIPPGSRTTLYWAVYCKLANLNIKKKSSYKYN